MADFKGLKIGMQSFTLRNFDPAGMIERVKSLGLSYLELGKKHCDPADDAGRARAMELCKAAGITINACGVAPLSNDEAANRVWFEHARKMGVKILNANPTHDCMDLLDKLVSEYDICVGIHNHGPGSAWPDIATIENGIKDHDARIGLCVDAGHFLRVPVDPLAAMRHFKGRVHSYHLKDMDTDLHKKHDREYIVGQGPLDLKGSLDLLRDWKFAGPVSIEYEVHPEDPMDDLRVAMENIRKALA